MKTRNLILFFFWSLTSLFAQDYHPGDGVDFSGKPGSLKLINQRTGKVLAANLPYTAFVTDVNHGMIGVRLGNKFGIISVNGKVLIKTELTAPEENNYDGAFEFVGSYFAVYKKQLRTLVDSTGSYALPWDKYEELFDAGYGICGGVKDGKFGLFKKGKQILPFGYERAFLYQPFSFQKTPDQAVEPFRYNNKFGLLSNTGDIILEPIFENVNQLNDHYFIFYNNNQAHVTPFSGKWILPTDFQEIYYIDDAYIMGKKEQYFGLIDMHGNEILPTKYDYLQVPVIDEHLFAFYEQKLGLIDLKNPGATTFPYDNVRTEFNAAHVALVRKGKNYGMINSKGVEIVPCIYQTITDYPSFDLGPLIVSLNGKYGLLESNGRFKINCLYDSLGLPESYPITVKKNGKYGKLDELGQVVIPIEYDGIGSVLSGNDYPIISNGKFGIYRIGNGLITKPSYDSIGNFESNYITKSGKLFGLLANNGVSLLEPQVDAFYGSLAQGNMLAKKDGILVQYETETGNLMPLTPDSTRILEKTILYNFGGSRDGSTLEINGKTFYRIFGGTWFFVEKASGKVIGAPLYELGALGKSNKLVAKQFGQDYTIGLSTTGENLKPGFHRNVIVLLNFYTFITN